MIVRLFLAIYGILCLIGSTAKTVSTSFFQTDGETTTISVKKTTPVKAVGDQSELPTSFQKYKTYSKLSNLLEAATDGGKGQFFMLSNGEYRDVGEFTLKCHGVTIMAKHDGKAVIRPHSKGLRIIIEGHNNTIKGFQFMYGSGVTGKAIIEVSGNRNILTNLNFYHMDATHYIKFNSGSKMNTLSHSNFEYKPSEAAAVSGVLILIESGGVKGYHLISHCGIQAIPGSSGTFGMESIKMGSDGDDIGRNIVEYTVFNGTSLGVSESIAIKSSQNIIRYSTFTNNNNAMIEFVSGDYNVAYGNWFIGAGGFSIADSNNVYIYNNYFQSAGMSTDMEYPTYTITNPITFAGTTTESTSAEEGQGEGETGYSSKYKNNIVVAHNTFIECEYINLGWVVSSDKNIWFANNLFKKTEGSIFAGIGSSVHFSGNMYSGNLGASLDNSVSETEFYAVDGDSVVSFSDMYGYYAPDSSSQALQGALAYPPDDALALFDIPELDDDPYIALDITGRPRPGTQTDVGCSQYYTTADAVANTPLNVDNVGPDYIDSYTPTLQPTTFFRPSYRPTVAPSQPSPEPSSSPFWAEDHKDDEKKKNNDDVTNVDVTADSEGEKVIIDIHAPFAAGARGKTQGLGQSQAQEATTSEIISDVVDADTEVAVTEATTGSENEGEDEQQLQKQKEAEKQAAKKASNAQPQS